MMKSTNERIDALSDETAEIILKQVQDYKKRKRQRKSTYVFANLNAVQVNVKGSVRMPIVTCTKVDALKYVMGEMLHEIDKKSMAVIKGMAAEAVELLAATEVSPAKAKFLRSRVCNWIMMDDPEKLVLSIGSFAASLR